MPLWSVCIPTAGESSTLQVVSSVLSQKTLFSFEVVVAGNIPDNLPSSPTLKTIHLGLVPPGKARNEAVYHANGKFIAFLDSDCIAQPGWLDCFNNRVKAGARLIGGSILFPRSNFFSLADNIACFFDQTPFMKSGFVETIASLNMACTKQVFDEIGPFDPSLPAGEDLDWILRAKQKRVVPFFDPGARCIHQNSRNTFVSVIRHASLWGKHSIHIRKNHLDSLHTPSLFFHSAWLCLLSPWIGAAFSVRILAAPGMWKYVYTWPILAAAKTAWCMAAASEQIQI